jgi:hypothetical protein
MDHKHELLVWAVVSAVFMAWGLWTAFEGLKIVPDTPFKEWSQEVSFIMGLCAFLAAAAAELLFLKEMWNIK